MTEELYRLREEFASLPDGFSRYSYLLELSSLLDTGHPALRREENLYRGCQSAVWLLPKVENGAVKLYADSDSLLLRGVLYLYSAVLDGTDPSGPDPEGEDLVDALGLSEFFDSARTAGIRGLRGEIRRRLGAGTTA